MSAFEGKADMVCCNTNFRNDTFRTFGNWCRRCAMQCAASDFCCLEHHTHYLQFGMGQWNFWKSLLTYPKFNCFPFDGSEDQCVEICKGLLVFFQTLKDIGLPAHGHKGQWRTVIDSQIELTIGGETRTNGPGDSCNIPAGVEHSGRLPAGAKIIDFF